MVKICHCYFSLLLTPLIRLYTDVFMTEFFYNSYDPMIIKVLALSLSYNTGSMRTFHVVADV